MLAILPSPTLTFHHSSRFTPKKSRSQKRSTRRKPGTRSEPRPEYAAEARGALGTSPKKPAGCSGALEPLSKCVADHEVPRNQRQRFVQEPRFRREQCPKYRAAGAGTPAATRFPPDESDDDARNRCGRTKKKGGFRESIDNGENVRAGNLGNNAKGCVEKVRARALHPPCTPPSHHDHPHQQYPSPSSSHTPRFTRYQTSTSSLLGLDGRRRFRRRRVR